MPGYPIELDLRGRLALVVGLGPVGRRKALGLLDAGAKVIGVDPNAALSAPDGVHHRVEAFRSDHLEGASLAFAAATPEVNREVVAEAKKRGVWVNAASEPEAGDFTIPAVWRGGLVVLTVSTSGASPALARAIRDRAVRAIGAAPEVAALLAELRPEVLARVADPAIRRELLASWGDATSLDIWTSGGLEALRSAWIEDLRAAETSSQRTALHESDDFS